MRATPLAAILLLLVSMAPAPANNVGSVPLPLQDLPVTETMGERLSRYWRDLRDHLGIGASSVNLARQYTQPGARVEDFDWLMEQAGYKLKEIESTIGLVPGLSLEFGQARELSDADREFLDRSLERHARRNPGIFATVQRMIVAGIVEASEIEGFSVEKVKVSLLPLPYVRLTLAPNDAPLSLATSRILRAIERLNQRLETTTPGRQGG